MPIGIIAVLWEMYSIVVVSFPSSTNPTPNTMNYTAAVSGGWIILCLVYFFFPKYGGMYWFEGPRANLEAEESATQSESGSIDEKRMIS